MKFCTQCENMYYLGLSEADTNNLQYYCRNCKHVDETTSTDGGCILDTQFKQSEQHMDHIVNRYTKFDPTLPRVYNIKCPNSKCSSNADGEDSKTNEVVYLRYNDDSLKYLYICTTCDAKWKTHTK
jgi:DNA-directed RNA polymerase subunit M/transcription elongation factor TFIIS